MSSNRKITLKRSDGETFEVDELVAMESQSIKHMIEDDCADNGIPLPNIASNILAKVIEYCKKHVEASKSEDPTSTGVDDDLKAWDAEFVKVDQATLFDLIGAANYLNINSLLDLTCQTVADMIKGKTPEEISKILHINFKEEIRKILHINFKEGEGLFEQVAYRFLGHPFFQDRCFFRYRRYRLFLYRRVLIDHNFSLEGVPRHPHEPGRLFFEEVSRSFQDLLFCRYCHLFEGLDGRFPEYLNFQDPYVVAAVRSVLDDLYIAEKEARRLRDHICF